MMIKPMGNAALMFCGLFLLCGATIAAESSVPEPFRESNEDSRYAINYDDLTALLNTVVVDTGRSTRRVAQEAPDVTGTRMKSKVKRTANEGNRFYYETFKNDAEAQQYLRNIQASLEELPSEAPLKHFSRDEQLAYWLNLYNVTVINQVLEIYPKKNLSKLFRGKKSIFDKKLLNVAGIPLSLNDIQFTILMQNYDNNPLIMYGLYQGIIGGPNIRKSAYIGADVWRALEYNAAEFVNSNRGTYARDARTFRVSSMYDRNSAYFADFNADLSEHLLQYLDGKERNMIQAASKIKADIDDWNVTDLSGSSRHVGGSFATSRAALLDSMRSTVPGKASDPMDGSTLGASVGHGSSSTAAKGQRLSRIEPELLAILHDINDKRLAENQRSAHVEIQDLGDDAKTESTTTEGSGADEEN